MAWRIGGLGSVVPATPEQEGEGEGVGSAASASENLGRRVVRCILSRTAAPSSYLVPAGSLVSRRRSRTRGRASTRTVREQAGNAQLAVATSVALERSSSTERRIGLDQPLHQGRGDPGSGRQEQVERKAAQCGRVDGPFSKGESTSRRYASRSTSSRGMTCSRIVESVRAFRSPSTARSIR